MVLNIYRTGPGYAPAAAATAAHKPAPASVVRQRVQLPPSTTLTKTSSPPKQQKVQKRINYFQS